MKRIALILLVVSIILIGCSGIQITDNVQSLAIKEAAMTAGYRLAQKNPEIAKAAASYAAAMLEAAKNGSIKATVWKEGVTLLCKQLDGDPLVLMLIFDVLDMVQFDDASISESTRSENVRGALFGFITGIGMVQ